MNRARPAAQWADLKATSPLQFADYVRRSRYGLHGGISGQSLAAALNRFDGGYLREAVLIWDKQCSRDDMIKNVKPKREKAVSRRDWQVLTRDSSGAAKAHQKALTEFWNGVRAVNAWDHNQRGGFALLVRQMMEAQSYKYGAHHLVWSPSSSALGCTFEHVPLHFFENVTGQLRFCPTGFESEGQDMPESEWMVTMGDGLMQAGSIGAFAKSEALTSWLVFAEAFGMPGVLGRTNQGKDTPGGIAMAEAVDAFTSDMRAVIYGDDGSGKIELVRTDGSANGMPFPALLERADRRLAALWRGADLSSMSSGAGAGTGASLQDSEGEIIEVDDALTISERLEEIERMVIEWWFGRGVKPKAYIRLLVPQSEDLKLLLQAIESLVKLKAPIAVNDVLERFGFAQPKAGEALLGEDSKDQDNADAQRINADAAEDEFMRNASRLLAKASAEDRTQLVEQLREVLRTPEADGLVVALNAFIKGLPEQIGQDAAQVRAWERILGSALINGWAAEQVTKPE
jgi:uncharacterized protein DUF935